MKIEKINWVISEGCPVRLETAPTGPEENVELPNYFLRPHKQVSILNMHILHRWRAGKPRPYGCDTY